MFGVETIHENKLCHPDAYGGRFDVSWDGGSTDATRLSHWLNPGNSIAMTTNTTNVANLLQQPVPNSYLPVSGNNVVCGNSQTYTITGLSPNATVTWQLLPPTVGNQYQLPVQNICSMTTNGNQATLTKIRNGNIRLFATIQYCGGISQFANKEVTFGVSEIINNGAYAGVSSYKTIVGTIEQIDGTANSVSMAFPNNNQYTFTKTNGSGNANWVNWSNGNIGIFFSNPVNSYSNIVFNVQTSNACGNTNTPITFYYNGVPMSFVISPNPATDFIKIEQVNDIANKIENTPPTIKIELVNKMGIITYMKDFKNFTSGTITIPVAQLKNDIYTIRIFD